MTPPGIKLREASLTLPVHPVKNFFYGCYDETRYIKPKHALPPVFKQRLLKQPKHGRSQFVTSQNVFRECHQVAD